MWAYKHYNPKASRPPPPVELPPQAIPTPQEMSFSWSSLFSDNRTSRKIANKLFLPSGPRQLLSPSSPDELVKASGSIDSFGRIAKEAYGLMGREQGENERQMRRIFRMLEDMADQWEVSKGITPNSRIQEDGDHYDDGRGRGREGERRGHDKHRHHHHHHRDRSHSRRRRRRSRSSSSSLSDDSDDSGDNVSARSQGRSKSRPTDKSKGETSSAVVDRKGKSKESDGEMARLLKHMEGKHGTSSSNPPSSGKQCSSSSSKKIPEPTDEQLKSMSKEEMKALLKQLEGESGDARLPSSSSSKGKEKERSGDPFAGLTKGDLEGMSPEEMKRLMRHAEASKAKSAAAAQTSSKSSNARERDEAGSSSSGGIAAMLATLSQDDLKKMSKEQLDEVMRQLEKEKKQQAGNSGGSAGGREASSSKSKKEPLGPDPIAGFSKEELKAMDPDKMKRLMKEREAWKAKRDAPAGAASSSAPRKDTLGPDPLAGLSKEDLQKLAPEEMKKLMKQREAWKAKRDGAAKSNVEAEEPLGPDPMAGLKKEDLEKMDPEDMKRLMKKREAWKAKRDAGTMSSDPLAGISKEDLKSMSQDQLKALLKKCDVSSGKSSSEPPKPKPTSTSESRPPISKSKTSDLMAGLPDALKHLSPEELGKLSQEEIMRLMSKGRPKLSSSSGKPLTSPATTSAKPSATPLVKPSPTETGSSRKDDDEIERLDDGKTIGSGGKSQKESDSDGSDDGLDEFLPPRRGTADRRRPLTRPEVAHAMRQNSDTHNPQAFDWPNADEIVTSQPRRPASSRPRPEPLRTTDSSDSESMISDLHPPSALDDHGFDVVFPQTPSHEPQSTQQGFDWASPERKQPFSAPPGPRPQTSTRSRINPPRSAGASQHGLADEYFHPERHPETDHSAWTSTAPGAYFAPMKAPPASSSKEMVNGDRSGDGAITNPLFGRVVSLMKKCIDVGRHLDAKHSSGIGKVLDLTPEHAMIRSNHEWLSQQLAPLQQATELFQHADADHMLEFMESLARLHGHLEMPQLLRRKWDQDWHAVHQGHHSKVKRLFLMMAAGAVISYLTSKIWHLSSGMLPTLEGCLQIIHDEDGSPESILSILPKIRGQLHSVSKERRALPDAQAEWFEASSLLDVLYEIAMDAIQPAIPPHNTSTLSRPPGSSSGGKRPGDLLVCKGVESSPKLKTSSIEESKTRQSPLVPLHDGEGVKDEGRAVESSQQLKAANGEIEISADYSEQGVAPEPRRNSFTTSLTRGNSLGLTSPEKLSKPVPSAVGGQSASSPPETMTTSIPEPRTPRRVMETSTTTYPAVAQTFKPAASPNTQTSSPTSRQVQLPSDEEELDYSPLQDLLESYFPGNGENLARTLAAKRTSLPILATGPVPPIKLRSAQPSPPQTQRPLKRLAGPDSGGTLEVEERTAEPKRDEAAMKQRTPESTPSSRGTSTRSPAIVTGALLSDGPGIVPVDPSRSPLKREQGLAEDTSVAPPSPRVSTPALSEVQRSPSPPSAIRPERPTQQLLSASFPRNKALLGETSQPRATTSPATSRVRPSLSPIQTVPLQTAPATVTGSRTASKILNAPLRTAARRSRTVTRTRTALVRSSSIEAPGSFAPVINSPLRESALAELTSDDEDGGDTVSLRPISEESIMAPSVVSLAIREAEMNHQERLSGSSSSDMLEESGEASMGDTVVDVDAIGEREVEEAFAEQVAAREREEAVGEDGLVPVLGSEDVLRERPPPELSMMESESIQEVGMTDAERRFMREQSSDEAVLSPKIYTTTNVRAGDISYNDVPGVSRRGIPRVEITPGAIQNIDGFAVALEDEQMYLDRGEKLVDGSGRVWDKNGLVEPATDDDGDYILYDEDYAQLKRDNYGQMPTYFPWERRDINEGPESPRESLSGGSNDDREPSVASDFTTSIANGTPERSLEDIDDELGPDGIPLDEVEMYEREMIDEGEMTPMERDDSNPWAEKIERMGVEGVEVKTAPKQPY